MSARRADGQDSDDVARLRRWEDAGGTWQLLPTSGPSVTVALRRCDGGEEVDRFSSTDQRLIDYLGGRTSST
jgi:hypothetical protein